MIKAESFQKVAKGVNQEVYTFLSSIKFAHEELKLSYRYISKLLGVSHTTVTNWAKGKKVPNSSTIKRCHMVLLDLIEANTYKPPEISDFSLNHMGPPDNYFSFKAADDPFTKKVLGFLTYYEGVLNLGNKVLLDTAAYYVRAYLDENKVKRSEAGMLALATLKVAMLKFGVHRNISHLIEDQELFSKFFVSLAIKYLSDLRGREVAETEQIKQQQQ